jgi:hypothetical protein
MLSTHAVPRTDPFSTTMAGHPWYAWEWLYDLLVGMIHTAAGLNGVVLFTSVVIALAFSLTFRRMRERGANVPVAVLLLLLAVFASAIHFFARPHVLSWVFAILWFEILDTSESRGNIRRLWWLPALTVLWVNLHGGFLLGFALLGIYLVAGCAGWARAGAEQKRAARWVRALAIITGICAAATFLNPYGYHLHAHIYQYLTDRFLMNHIQEFGSPDFHGVAQQCFAGLLLITLVALATAHGKLRVSHLLVIVLAAYSGLYAARNIPTSSILLVLLIGPILSRAISGLAADIHVAPMVSKLAAGLNRFDTRMSVSDQAARGHLWPILLIALGTVASLHGGQIGSYGLMDAQFSAPRFPVKAVALIQEKRIHQPIFAPDYWGGYLLYRLYPRNKVIIDDRHDLYGDQILQDYLKVIHVQTGWDEVLRRMGADWVLMPENSSVANLLKISPGWELVYSDKTAALYHRKTDSQQ